MILISLLKSLEPRDGGWSSLEPSSWDDTPCCNGLLTRRRNCDNPSPAHGGADCQGSSTKTRDCDECIRGLDGCQHYCHNHDHTVSPLTFVCSCERGFRLSAEDSKSCESKCIHFVFSIFRPFEFCCCRCYRIDLLALTKNIIFFIPGAQIWIVKLLRETSKFSPLFVHIKRTCPLKWEVCAQCITVL